MAVVVDSSALAAIVFGESDARALASTLVTHVGDVSLSAATAVEVSIVVEARHGRDALQDLHTLLNRVGAVVVPVDEAQADLAIGAWRRYGTGRHEAGLNYGDCFSYALAKQLGLPLLFKGEDFSRTDIASA